jgi:Flp pilus assembly protein TadD
MREKGLLKEAEMDYNIALELNPNDAKIYINLGSLYRDMG